MQLTNSYIPKLFCQPPMSLDKRKSDLISKPSFLPWGKWSPGVLPLNFGSLQILFPSQLLPISHSVWMPRPSVGTKVGWGRRATSALATQMLTSPPKYFKRAKLGCRIWLRLFMQWALWANLLVLVLITWRYAKSRVVCSPWDSMGFYRQFLLARWCLHIQCGEKKRKEQATCSSPCADFRISQDHSSVWSPVYTVTYIPIWTSQVHMHLKESE